MNSQIRAFTGGSVQRITTTARDGVSGFTKGRAVTGDAPVHGGPPPKVKLNYVDAAKGVAVILVVLWHATEGELVAFQALSYLRMPLFFFAAGLFAARGLDAPWREFLTVRVGQILWLFVLWTPVVYFATEGVGNVVKDELTATEAMQPLELFAEPPQTLWFLYALGTMYLVAKLVRPLDWRIVLGASLLGYGLVVTVLAAPTDPLLVMLYKVVRFSPFFLIASYHSQLIRAAIQERAKWGILGLLAYAVLASCLVGFHLADNPPARFATSAVGILSLMMTLYHHDGSPVVRALNKIGSRSLFVFVLHRIPLFYYVEVLEALGLKENMPARLVGGFVIVAGCWFVGEYILSKYAKWTMEAPWLTARKLSAA